MENFDSAIETKKNGFFDNFFFFILVAFTFLMPLFFIPSVFFAGITGKFGLLMLTVFVLTIFWWISKFKTKEIETPRFLLSFSLVLVPAVYLISSLSSGSIMINLIGKDFETTTFAFVFTLFLLFLLVSKIKINKNKILSIFGALIFSSVIMMVVHLIRLFVGPSFLSLGLLTGVIDNLIGSWSELGIFLGLISVLSLVAGLFMRNNKKGLTLTYVILALSLFFIALVNFGALWISLAIFSALIAIYSFVFVDKKIPVTPIVVLILSLVFVFSSTVANFLPNRLKISNLEVRPSVSSTLGLVEMSNLKKLFLGAGPDSFEKEWISKKPIEVNSSEFWNASFPMGSNFIVSSLVTVGVLGFFGWLLFLGIILFFGARLLKASRLNPINHFVSAVVYFAVLYLVLFLFIYNPGVVLLSLTFLFLGLLLSLIYSENIILQNKITFISNKGKSISFLTGATLLVIFTAYTSFVSGEKVLASSQFQKAVTAVNIDGDLNKSFELMNKAANTFETDFYYRSLSDLSLLQLQALFNQEGVDEKTLQEEFQRIFGNATIYSQMAIKADKDNYLNWANIGKVYANIVPLKTEGAYDTATQSYFKALELNPTNPSLVLNLANLELANENIDKAKEYIVGAIQFKNNYSDAYYMLAQIELDAKNNDEALNILRALVKANQTDPQAYFQLGLLDYNLDNTEEAVAVLEQAVILSPYYIDARYLLGVNYYVAKETEKALAQFNIVKELNPQDTTIDTIIENAKAGRNLFYGLEQATETTQTSTEEVPVEEAE
ncbi:MAG: tetratricopeptide repeat protein [Patescibacteria group bacterium]